MPHIDFDSHRRDAEVEDVQFLIDHGAPFDVACRRVGVNPITMEQRIRRAPEEGTTQ